MKIRMLIVPVLLTVLLASVGGCSGAIPPIPPDPDDEQDQDTRFLQPPSTCSAGFYLRSNACTSCPRQADCCDDGDHFDTVGERCVRIPDVCQRYRMPAQPCLRENNTPSCSSGSYFLSGSCVRCPAQADCCERDYSYNESDELCHPFPNGCYAHEPLVHECYPEPESPSEPDRDPAPEPEYPEETHLQAACPSLAAATVHNLALDFLNEFVLGADFTEVIDNAALACHDDCDENGACVDECFTCNSALINFAQYENLARASLPVAPPEPVVPDDTFVSGNVFSFLSEEETDYFLGRLPMQNQEIDRANPSTAPRGGCTAERRRVEQKRAGTFTLLTETALLFGSEIHPRSSAEITEVQRWNCTRYPNWAYSDPVSRAVCYIEIPCL